MNYRVFGTADQPTDPAAILEHLQDHQFPVAGHFRGDDLGWTRAEFLVPSSDTNIPIDQYIVGEDDIRSELNSWAAWLETCENQPQHQWLMEQVIQTKRFFVLERPTDPHDDARLDAICRTLCQYLAAQTAGLIQIDGHGFFAVDGRLLVQEC